MSPLLLIAVAVAGGAGSALRFVLDTVVSGRTRIAFPIGTNVINATGSFALGAVVGLMAGVVPSDVGLVLGTGLIGGFTTFSTASLDTMRLLLDGRVRPALLNGVALLLCNAGLAAVGLMLGYWMAA